MLHSVRHVTVHPVNQRGKFIIQQSFLAIFFNWMGFMRLIQTLGRVSFMRLKCQPQAKCRDCFRRLVGESLGFLNERGTWKGTRRRIPTILPENRLDSDKLSQI